MRVFLLAACQKSNTHASFSIAVLLLLYIPRSTVPFCLPVSTYEIQYYLSLSRHWDDNTSKSQDRESVYGWGIFDEPRSRDFVVNFLPISNDYDGVLVSNRFTVEKDRKIERLKNVWDEEKARLL